MTDTQAIKDRLDIVQLIHEYVPLKKAGTYWKAPCPFHHEKTPSFMVNPDKQIWKCFGCGKGGDAFSFIEEMEGIEFPEALKLLADRAGVKLENFRTEINSSQKNRILEINDKAAYFFHRFLLDMPTAKIARDYLSGRMLKTETIATWQVGYIPDQWDLLTQYLLKKGHSIDDLVASGLTIKRDGATPGSSRGFYDRFRGRIMFPILDVHGNTVGFTGRVLVETENSGGKYVNTPQTLVYDKSRVIYGLDKAKTEIKSKDLTVIVEGQMDVIACHQAGMKNVVAASGTALTFEQVKLLKRYSTNIAMAFDADKAGIAAAKRGIDVALSEGLNVRVIQIPEGAGKDADECLKKNPDVWFKAVAQATDIMPWFFQSVFTGHNLSNPKEKQIIANELLPLIGLIPYAIERDHWLKELSERLGTDTAVLREDLTRLQKTLKPGGIHQATKPETPVVAAVPKVDLGRLGVLLERFLMLGLKYPNLIYANLKELPDSTYLDSEYKILYEILKKQYTVISSFTTEILAELFSVSPVKDLKEMLEMRAELEYADFTIEMAGREVKVVVEDVISEWKKKYRKELQQAISQAEKAGDRATLEKLLTEFQNI